jgi:hypothetical protein
MKKGYVFLILLVGVLLIAALTNPTPERHKEALKLKFIASMQKSMHDNASSLGSDATNAGEAIGSLIGGAFIDGIVNNVVSTDNYVLFSITKVNWEGKTRTVGVGAFGNVFLSKEIDSILDRRGTEGEAGEE